MKKWIALRHYFMLLGCMLLFGLLTVLFDRFYSPHVSFLLGFLVMLIPLTYMLKQLSMLL